MKNRLYTLFIALVATTALWAQNNVITYTATEKLTETTDTYSSGLHTDAFNVAITSHTFSNGTGTITFAGDVTTIREVAFYGCSSLTSITLPNSVTTIGVIAFYGCSSLPVEDNLRYADTYLIEVVDKTLSTYTIKEGTKWIGDYAFRDCSELTSVTIPNSVITIGSQAFEDCSELTSVTIPNSVKTIGYNAFYGCSSLPIEDHLRYADTYLVEAIDKTLSTYTIKKGTKWIGSSAFSGCTGLTSVTIPNSVTTIGKAAFQNCRGLTSIIIPNSVTTIGDRAFNNCMSLTSVTIGNSVTTIGASAFYGCSGLSSITLPNSVITIGDNAFQHCTSATSVTIGESVTTIGNQAFYECTSLASIEIPASVITIEDRAFAQCTSATSITIGESVTTIGDYAFPVGFSVTSINVDASNKYYASEDGVLFTYAKDTLILYPTGNTRTEYAIPNSVTTIGKSAFWGCSALASVTIPNSVTTIGQEAFSMCIPLTSIELASSITTIGDWAFYNCGLTSITIPSSVTTIGESAFYDCIYLTSVTIGTSVTTIGNQAFYDCIGLTSITIPNSVTTIGEDAFYFVNNIVYNGTVSGSPWGAKCVNGYVDGYLVYSDATKTKLCGCSSAIAGNVTIPNSVTTIGEAAFAYCSGLTSVTIPNSVTTIGQEAFFGCTGLASITCEAITPPTCGTKSFNGVEKSIPLYVPAGSVDDYEKADQWKNFTNIQPIGGEEPDYTHIYYTSSDGKVVTPYKTNVFGADIVSNKYLDGQGVITFAGDVTTIGEEAFHWCGSLISITLPNSVTTIGDHAFNSCSGLTSVTIPNSVTTIGERAFWSCTGLTSITIPNSVTTIGVAAFNGCSGLTSFNVDAANTHYCSIDGVLFNYAKNTLIQYPNGNTRTEYSIPNSVTTIGEYAFYKCSGLTSITIPNSITTIGQEAFVNCFGLTSVTIPNSVTTIGQEAFANCSGLTSINVDATNTHYCSIDGVLFNYAKDTLIQYPIGNTRTQYTIPNSVTTIGKYAFDGCSGLKSVTIGNSVNTIGYQAFYGCSSLTSVTCKATTPPTCSDYCFDFVDKYLPVFIFLYVPAGSVDVYEKTYPWSEFHEIQPYPSGDDCEPISGTCGANLSWTLSCDSVLTISGKGEIYDYDTTNNTAPWHSNCDKIKYCIIEDGITTIGKRAFYECSSLISIDIPSSVTVIDEHTFQNCSSLISITIPSSVTTIGTGAFIGCSSLTSVTIPNSVTTIGIVAFAKCSSLSSINVDSSNKYYVSVEGVLFNYAKNTLVQYPAGNTQKQYTIPASVTTINIGAFEYCNSLTSITIPNSVTTIGDWAFVGCSSLTSITIPASITTIGYHAFDCCAGLTSITCEAVIPPTCGSYCFDNVDKSIPLYVPYQSIDAYQSADQWKNFTNIQPIGGEEPQNNVITYKATKKLSETTDDISPGIHTNAFNVAITSHTFSNGTGTVTFAGDVTTIGNSAFKNCGGVTSITIPNSVTTIGQQAFESCSGLTSVTIPNSVTTIGSYAFECCSGLTSVTIPHSVTMIGAGAFISCESLTSINVDTSNENYTSVDGVLFNYTKDTIIQYPGGKTQTEYSIPNSVTTIGDHAFNRCRGLTSVTFGNSVTTIGKEAFRYCSGLTSVTIPNSVTTIGDWAFYGCSGMTSVTMGNSVTTIGEMAFDECSGLTSVTIPNSVTTIGELAFAWCSNLTLVTIGSSVTTIGDYAFSLCTSLTSVTIPCSVTTIGMLAFNWCSSLTSITCEATTPPTCGTDCFNKVSTSIPVYVPYEAIDAYKQANEWKRFYNIKDIGGEEDPGNTIKNTTTTISELEAWVTVPLDAKGEVTKYSYWLYLDNAHTDLVCSMDFDATGKMSNPVIRKAPMREQAEEEQTVDSFTFEVSGLEANTTYYYVLKAFTNAKTFTKEGSFTTQSSAVRNAPQIKKVCKPNGICLEVDGNTYDIWGNIIQ